MKIGAGNAKGGGGQLLAHQLVPGGVGDGQHQRLFLRRFERRGIERQAAQMNHLPRLVDRLVGTEHDIIDAANVDLLAGL